MAAHEFYSQHGEDQILGAIFARDEGICVEVGAFDGVSHSNTFHLESRGWKCILVEPNPELCAAIRASRLATLYACAASDRDDETTLKLCENFPALSTVESQQRCGEKVANRGRLRSVRVPTRTLDGILEECGVRNLDFISIDVEGHELSVLKGFTLSRWSPKIIIIEDLAELADHSVPSYMKQYGYKRFLRTGCNDWYARDADRELFTWRAAVNRGLWRTRLAIKRNLPQSALSVLRPVFWRLTGKL